MSVYSPIEKILAGTLIGPFFEEFLYRVVFFTTIAYIVGFIDTKLNTKISEKVLNLKSIFCWGLIIFNNILFSLSHLPDLSNFHLYFVVGVVITVIYIKFGFYGSWICHGAFNYFSFKYLYIWIVNH
ncbi:MAG: CPBP family intramembrane glutamic endopeptidase [Clostridium sp.]